MGATVSAATSAKSRQLHIFISHASEDLNLACTIAGCLKNALGEFPQINLDKWFMQVGKDFRDQLQDKLQQSDILIIVFTDRVGDRLLGRLARPAFPVR